jgi:hypothetical protein
MIKGSVRHLKSQETSGMAHQDEPLPRGLLLGGDQTRPLSQSEGHTFHLMLTIHRPTGEGPSTQAVIVDEGPTSEGASDLVDDRNRSATLKAFASTSSKGLPSFDKA